MTLPQFVFWQTLWIIVFIFGIFPSQFAFLSTLLGIDRIVDLFLYVSIGLLFYMIYRLYAKMNALQQEMTKLTRAIAVGHAKNPKKSKQ
jgi:small membrane protein